MTTITLTLSLLSPLPAANFRGFMQKLEGQGLNDHQDYCMTPAVLNLLRLMVHLVNCVSGGGPPRPSREKISIYPLKFPNNIFYSITENMFSPITPKFIYVYTLTGPIWLLSRD